MAAILDIPEVRLRVSRLSVDEYHRHQEQRLFGFGETIDCSSLPGVRIRISDLFV